MATKKVKKKFHALVKQFTDGSIKIEPIDPSEWRDWQQVNMEMKEDKRQRVPRAESFLRSIDMHVPGTPVPENLLALAADQQVYRGPLREAAEKMSLLHVVQFLDS